MMDQKEWRTMDKSKWGPGLWQDEPDKVQWIDEATDLDCLVVRNGGGALCGYVGVPPGHPLHGMDYDAVDDKTNIRVHGGLTFSDACQEHAEEGRGVCHVPEPGRPADVWWLGFDCAHHGDLSPKWDSEYAMFGGFYKDLGWVRSEVARLARQVAAVTT